MPLRVEFWGGLALALAAPGVTIAAEKAPPPPDAPSTYTSEKVSYDEVGYGGALETDPNVAATHGSLPAGSFAEITDLDTGRTILVRIAAGTPPAGRMVGLSSSAQRQLGTEGRDPLPVRVRRVNPPEFERAALAQGQTAKERLETPPALLSALKKRLAAQPTPKTVIAKAPGAVAKSPKPTANKPVPVVKTPATVVKPPPVAAVPVAVAKAPPSPPAKPEPKTVVAPPPKPPAPAKPAAGVDFDTGSASPPPRDMSRPHWDDEVMTKGGDEFIVEQAEEAAKTIGQPRTPRRPAAVASPRPVPPPASAVPQSAAQAGWYVQVGAFANAANARATAARVGGGIVQAGRLHRVRTGPYASEAAARAALGGLAAKGYRGARVTR